MNRVSNLLWGIVFMVLAVIWGLNNLEITNINVFFDGWWTLFIIVPCFIGLFKNESKTGNLIGLGIGLFLLGSCWGLVSFDLLWKLLMPFILFMIGLSFVFKDNFKGQFKDFEAKKGEHEYCATFGSQNVNFNGEKFSGCSLTAVFGGVKCDLREAKIEKDACIEVSAIFGGVDILVPEDVEVKVSSTPIFGGVSNNRYNRVRDSKKTIYVKVEVMFGGVEIK